MSRSVYVDQDSCISCGLCIDNLPTVFRYADNGKAECYDPQGAPESDIESQAVAVCPVGCIHWQ